MKYFIAKKESNIKSANNWKCFKSKKTAYLKTQKRILFLGIRLNSSFFFNQIKIVKSFNTKLLSHGIVWILCQRYKMKPIHNSADKFEFASDSVNTMSKIQNETNSQPRWIYKNIKCKCEYYVKDTKWNQFTTGDFLQYRLSKVWILCQRHKMKPIHNAFALTLKTALSVNTMSKIQNETNSQLEP